MLPFFVWMLTSAENVTEEAQPIIEDQVEYRTRLSIAFQLFLPVAGLIFLFFKQKNIFNRLLLHLDRNCVSVFCPSFSKREKLLKWASSRLPTNWSSTSKTLSGGISELWTDGSLLCTLINTAIPGACPNPYRHWKKPPTHAQGIAYKYLGMIPLFTDKELHEPLNPNLEKNFIHYLTELQKAVAKLSENKEAITTVSDQYITRGMGLFSGEQHRKTIFYIYVDDSTSNSNNSTILIQIRGPYGTFGKAVIPKFPNSLFNAPESDSLEKMMPKNFKPTTNFIKKFSLPFMRYHKKHNGDNITIDVIIEGNKAKITYIPKNFGMYEINMVANGELIKGCPFSVHIFKNSSGLKDSFEYQLPESTTYKTRKILSKTIDLVDETVPVDKLNEKYGTERRIEEEIRTIKKHKIDFDEVIKQISKNEERSKYFAEEKDTGTDLQVNNDITTIEEVEEVVESELESGLGFSETISEISNENDDFRLYLENRKDSNFSSLESQDCPIIFEENSENNELVDNNHDPDNTDNESHKQEAVKFNAKSILTKQNMTQHYDNRESTITQPHVVINEYVDKGNINRVKIPERFSEFRSNHLDSKFLKNVVNNSSKNEALKKYFQASDTVDNKKKNTGEELEKYQKVSVENVVTHRAVIENVVLLPSRLITDYEVITNVSKVENSPKETDLPKENNNYSNTKNIPPFRRLSSREFLQQMLESDSSSSDKPSQIKCDVNNISSDIKEPEKDVEEKKIPTRVLIEKFSKKNEKVIPLAKFEKTVVKNVPLASSLSQKSHRLNKALEQSEILRTSSKIDASPICSSHIEPEVGYKEMSVDEKRKIFARKNVETSSTSKISSFSEAAENAEVSKPQRHLQFEGLSVLNVLGSLKQSQTVPVITKRPLSTTVSLPNISTTESGYVFPQMVKEKKHFWEDLMAPGIKNQTNNKPKDPSSHNRKTRAVWVRSRTVDATNEDVVSDQISQLPAPAQPSSKPSSEFENQDFKDVVKERTSFWEKVLPSPSSFRNKREAAWFKQNEPKPSLINQSLELEDDSLSSLEPNSFNSLDTSCNSLPNISLSNDQHLVKQKKSFWEKLSSKSSSNLSIRSTKQRVNEQDRIKLIWKKPTAFENRRKSEEEKSVDIYKSADDILSMTNYFPHQSVKRYKSVDNSLDTCTNLSIEERKKMLLKQNYQKEQQEKEKVFFSKKNVISVKEVAEEEIDVRNKVDGSFSPVEEKIRKFNSVSNLDFIQQEKPKETPIRTDYPQYQPPPTPISSQKSKLKSHFKRAVRYFKNLEAKSLGRPTAKSDKFTTKLTLEIHHGRGPARRGGSLNFANVSRRFSVSNLYEDVMGNRKGSFRGPPNRSALVEALATFSRRPISDDKDNSEDEDTIRYEIFRKNIKTKRRRSLRSVFDIYY